MAAATMSSVASQVRSRILMSGPIPVADYMRLALTQTNAVEVFNQNGDAKVSSSKKEQGYYMTKDVFGQHGDFITSPEITQMFGEVLGAWGIQCWRQLRGPSKFQVVELGPGRGTLTRDMLRVFKQFESVIGSDISMNLVEISPYLSKLQYETLCEQQDEDKDLPIAVNSNSFQTGLSKDSHCSISWYKEIREVPRGFSLYVAHEFLDALPVHKLQKVNGEWRELLVDVNSDTNLGFRFVLSRHETPVLKVLKSLYPNVLATPRDHLEISLDALVVLEELTSRLDEHGGIAVIVDYGHDGTKGDTFRAFRKHKLHDPLVEPGSADLTADVDFSIIKQVFSEKALICGPVSQYDFLSRVGIDLRLESLLKAANSETERDNLQSGYKMIMSEMGTRFHFISLFPKVLEQFLPRLKIAGFHE